MAATDETMQLRPGLAHAPDRGVVGGHGQGHEDDEGRHPDGDVGPLDDVGDDGRDVEALVENEIGGEMQGRVVEGEQAERPAIAQQIDVEELAAAA